MKNRNRKSGGAYDVVSSGTWSSFVPLRIPYLGLGGYGDDVYVGEKNRRRMCRTTTRKTKRPSDGREEGEGRVARVWPGLGRQG